MTVERPEKEHCEQVRIVTVGQCWYLQSKIGSFDVDFLVDSGSMPSILSHDVWESLKGPEKGPLRSSKVILFGATGSELKVVGEAVINMTLSEHTLNVSCLVA